MPPVTRCALGYREAGFAEAARRAPLVVLAGCDESTQALLDALGDSFHLTVLEGPRRTPPRRFGVPAQGSDWYVGDERAPDPASFGLCLVQLERFLLEREERGQSTGGEPARPVLVGSGRGAALSLALACCWPELLRGVVAIGGCLPELPPGALVETPLRGLPVAIALSAQGRASPASSAALLRERGAQVTLLDAIGALPLAADIRRWLPPL